MFILILITSCVLGVSLNNILITWRIIEINILLFIPILGLSNGVKNPDIIRFKYFFTQSLASIIFFIRILILILLPMEVTKISILFSLRLAWKLGVPPFHIWLLNLLIELDWLLFFIISSWQKILPFYIIGQIILEAIEFFILFCLLVSVGIAMYLVSIKKLLIISSIFTRGWVLRSIIFIKIWWLLFFFLYSTILLFCCLIFYIGKVDNLKIARLSSLSLTEKIGVFILLISMAGLPPFLGFYIKLLILLILLHHLKIFILFSIVLSSVLIIYLYLRIFLRALTLQRLTIKSRFSYKTTNYPIFFTRIYIFSPLILSVY